MITTYHPLDIQKGQQVLRALNHPFRQQLIEVIAQAGKMTVKQVVAHFGMYQCVISNQLSALRKAGILITKREGRFIHYSVNLSGLQQIQGACETLNNILNS